MEIGILGLKQSGKSTLFEIMTGIRSRDIFGEPSVRGVAKVPDRRFDELVRIFKPAKITPASVPFIDTCAQGENQWDAIRKALSAADGLIHVVDGFTANDADEVANRYAKLADELVISDLMVVENRLGRIMKIPKSSMKPEEAAHAEILPRAKEALEAGKPLKSLEFSADEIHALRSFAFWTLRPEVVVVNTREDNRSLAEEFAGKSKLGSPVIGICCEMEAEIATLPPDERKGFLEAMGATEAAFELIIRTSFALLGRMYYFTAGEDEVRAWMIPAGSTAPSAAAAIHKDFERGFIKAEVVSYDDFIAQGGTLAGAKAAGLLRLEGKEYIVKDGDIISFRFNV
ncbi:MAG: DUF933 domain-containing protein [Pseudomonadota bacterium]